MTDAMQKAYDAELARHEQVILALANLRLQEFVQRQWDDTPLKLNFGMGTVYVEVDGVQANEEDYPELEEALQDVDDLTDGYRRACPTDIEV
jgi:hypothetical protein